MLNAKSLAAGVLIQSHRDSLHRQASFIVALQERCRHDTKSRLNFKPSYERLSSDVAGFDGVLEGFGVVGPGWNKFLSDVAFVTGF